LSEGRPPSDKQAVKDATLSSYAGLQQGYFAKPSYSIQYLPSADDSSVIEKDDTNNSDNKDVDDIDANESVNDNNKQVDDGGGQESVGSNKAAEEDKEYSVLRARLDVLTNNQAEVDSQDLENLPSPPEDLPQTRVSISASMI